MTIRPLYNKFTSYYSELSHLGGIQGLLDWDQNVMMPAGAAEVRAKQMSSLAGVIHKMGTDSEYGHMLEQISKSPQFAAELDRWEQANVRDALRDFEKHKNVPKELAQKLAALQSRGNTVWVEAREKKDFSLFAPVLEEWVALLKEKCRFVDPNVPPYQLLIDDYERGMQTQRFDELFEKLKAGLVPLIQAIKKSPVYAQHSQTNAFLSAQKFPVNLQTEFNHALAEDLGFDRNCGRLDVSVHPFTGGSHALDVRMTTRYKDTDLIEGITGTIHETGHALYEQGRNEKYHDLPVSQALSMGVHESQSLLWERMVGLSMPFWRRYFPKLQQKFAIGPEVTAEQFHRAINTVQPGFIRVESDEVTYPLHIIIRYEIEKGLFDGSIKVANVPAVWNAKMQEYLGITPTNDSEGCLQDTHWAVGLFGYFPTYTLGAIYASQIFQAALVKIPNLNECIGKGEFNVLKQWLNENIHQYGSLFPSGDELISRVTGQPLNADVFMQHLTSKYSAIYQLSK